MFNSEHVFAQMNQLLQEKNYQSAAQVLIDAVPLLTEQEHIAQLLLCFDKFPADFLCLSSDLCVAQAQVYAKLGRTQEAINLLERARYYYQYTEHNYNPAVFCCLEFVRLQLARGKFHSAHHYLTVEIAPLISSGLVDNLQLQAHYELRMSELCPDIGKVQSGKEHAERAFDLFRQIGDMNGQFLSLVRIMQAHIQIGENSNALGKLDMARLCITIGNLGITAKARLSNMETHLSWHSGELTKALASAYEYHLLSERERFSNFRVCACMLMGNLERDLAHYTQAEHWYDSAQRVINEIGYESYAPWIFAQRAWLFMLQGRNSEARALIHSSLRTADLRQSMSFQVILAILDLQEEHLSSAEHLLNESLQYYQESGDEVAVCTLLLYRAQFAIKQSLSDDSADQYLRQALDWLASKRVNYLPYWWHSQIFSELFIYAICRDIFPAMAEHILLSHLAHVCTPLLHKALLDDNPQLRSRASGLLQAIGADIYTELANLEESQSKRVLEEIIAQGSLRRESLPRLFQELTTSMRRGTPNATMIAVFALYVNGMGREAIAKKLDCSVANVRNYINAIYQHFGVPHDGFKSRRERQEYLVQMVRQQGFLQD